jgi:hypothetical protein
MDDSPVPAPTPGRRRAPAGLAAIGVVLVMVLIWWLLSGNGPQGPAGNDSRYAVPDVDVTGDPAGDPAGGSTGAADAEPAPSRENGVRIDGFVRGEGSGIALNYTTGVPECYGTLDTPEVLETSAAVTVTLTLRPPEPQPDAPCPDLAMLRTVRVQLGAALGDRSVLDGYYAQPVRVREVRRTNE